MPYARKPNIEILELKEDFIQFELSNTDLSVANALRRIMMAEVPTMAMTWWKLKKTLLFFMTSIFHTVWDSFLSKVQKCTPSIILETAIAQSVAQTAASN